MSISFSPLSRETRLLHPGCNSLSVLQTKSSPIFIPALGWTSFEPKGSIVLSAIFSSPKKMSAEEVARISLRDHMRLWKVRDLLFREQTFQFRRLTYRRNALLHWKEVGQAFL